MYEHYINGKVVEIPTTYFHVQRAMKHVGKGRYEVSARSMKTKKSRRRVSLPPILIDALTAHRRQQAEAMLASGESFERNDYIFPNKVGRPLDVNNVRDLFHKLCEAAEIRKIKLYGLRHTHATLLLAAGVHLKVVSERLGHSSIMLTGDVYSHVMPETETATAMTIDTLIRRSRKLG
jgi:integrase